MSRLLGGWAAAAKRALARCSGEGDHVVADGQLFEEFAEHDATLVRQRREARDRLGKRLYGGMRKAGVPEG